MPKVIKNNGLALSLSKINLGMTLIFCMSLGIHNYVFMIQSIHLSVVRHTKASQK